MPQDSDCQLNPLQNNIDNASPKEATASQLKLVVSNPTIEESPPPSTQPIISKVEFSAEVRNRGPYFYEMKAQDPSHYLECDLTLEVEENPDETELGTVICHFPTIIDEQLNRFIEGDDTLYGMAMIQFQMKVLQQLLSFCATHSASRLMIYMDDAQAEGFGIYEEFLSHYDEALTQNGEQTEMVIPSNQQTIDDLVDFMKETNLKFCQELWRDQRSNPAIRRYLKFHPFA